MTTSLHVHVVPSIGIGASVATDHDAWLTTGEPCILCGLTRPRYHVLFMQDGIKPTPAQQEALEAIKDRWHGVKVYHGAYGLPDGFLSLTLDPEGHPVYGGMDRDGSVST